MHSHNSKTWGWKYGYKRTFSLFLTIFLNFFFWLTVSQSFGLMYFFCIFLYFSLFWFLFSQSTISFYLLYIVNFEKRRRKHLTNTLRDQYTYQNLSFTIADDYDYLHFFFPLFEMRNSCLSSSAFFSTASNLFPLKEKLHFKTGADILLNFSCWSSMHSDNIFYHWFCFNSCKLPTQYVRSLTSCKGNRRSLGFCDKFISLKESWVTYPKNKAY